MTKTMRNRLLREGIAEAVALEKAKNPDSVNLFTEEEEEEKE